MPKPKIGLTGLGVMGRNLALNIADNGFDIGVHNRTDADVDDFLEKTKANESSGLADRVSGFHDVAEFVAGISTPRTIIMMVKSGDVVDRVIDGLKPHLDKGDLLIDAGNSDFNDTVRRTEQLEAEGFGYVGMGVSGGEVGARFGPSIMVGGSKDKFALIEDMVMAISAKHTNANGQNEPCAAWLGPDGAGNFVKTLHNGIEYGDMQMIAEAYGLMRNGLKLEPEEIGKIFQRWNKGPLQSYLIEISAEILQTADPETGKPIIDMILDRAGQKGTGRWSAIESQKLGIPASAIEAAVTARALSAGKEMRQGMEKLYGPVKSKLTAAQRDGLVDALELALLGGKIVAYAQGFAVIREASIAYKWNIPLDTVAEIWREGCIIRSVMLDDIATAFRDDPNLENLLQAPQFVERMKASSNPLRKVVSMSVQASLPVPALAATLSYFDYIRQAQSTANVLQGQRDFFGAHGYERTDKDGGDFHGPWAMG